jgi:hypothetical protein
MPTLLAVDLGLRTGLALYGGDGRLRWYRSHNIGSAARLKKAAHAVLSDLDDLALIVLEGGGSLADIWARAASKRGVHVRHVGAEVWRGRLLLARDRRSGRDAKRKAGDAARQVISWSGLSQPKALRHDAAEAILVGLWAVLDCGWAGDSPL